MFAQTDWQYCCLSLCFIDLNQSCGAFCLPRLGCLYAERLWCTCSTTVRQWCTILSVKADEKSSFRVRCPIGLRSESNQIAYAVRSDCVRWRWGKVEISWACSGGIGSFKLGFRAIEVDIIVRIVLFLSFLFMTLRYNF